jgi:RNA polymerase sigma-70 factor, ECF subfamily
VTDAELVELARRGDREAYDQLVERHQGAVYRAALAALRAPEEAEEVAQDAFVRAFAALDRYRGEASFKTWVLKIVWRRALSRRRSTWWNRQRAPSDSIDTTVDRAAGPEHQAAGAELERHLRRLIAALSPKLRDALLLATAGVYSYDEIAAMLGIPIGTLKWRISEARKQLRGALVALGYDQRA